MAFIELPDVEGVEESIKKQFKAAKAATGEVGETLRILAIRPDILSMTNKMVKTLLISQTELDPQTKEWLAIVISVENGCSMCVGEHKRIAQMLGITEEEIEGVLKGVESSDIPEKQKILLKFCVKSSKESYKVMRKDLDVLREAGYSDSQILEAVAIVGYFNYINTISNAMGSGK